jgi:hypothetical protein
MATPKPTQAFVPVSEVRNGVVILKEGGYRGIMMCSSLNFALKSEDEQKAIIGGFQNFLNTLDFTVQIVIHSRKTDIRPYLNLLSERLEHQTSELMRIQLREYIQFIRNFIEGSDIMTKTFYIVVPYSTNSAAVSVKGAFAGLGAAARSSVAAAPGVDVSFEESRVQLEQRMALVAGGLGSAGMENPISFTA